MFLELDLRLLLNSDFLGVLESNKCFLSESSFLMSVHGFFKSLSYTSFFFAFKGVYPLNGDGDSPVLSF